MTQGVSIKILKGVLGILGMIWGCPIEWAARIESKLSVIYIWGPSKFCSLDIG
jgi:hypothetical protein